MKRNTHSWLALVPSIVTLAAVYSILAWGEGQNIAAVLAGAASIVTTVVVVSIFAMQLVRDSRTIDTIAKETKETLSIVTQMKTTMDKFREEIALIEHQTKTQQRCMEDSETEKRILDENARLHRNYSEAVAYVVQLIQENQELKAQLNQEKKNQHRFARLGGKKYDKRHSRIRLAVISRSSFSS